MSSSFLLWKGMVQEERQNRVVVERYVKRWKGMYVMKCFITWVDFVVERRELRGVVKRFLGGKETQMMSGGFRSWKDWCNEERERERLLEKDRLKKALEENAKKASNNENLARKREEQIRQRGENAARNMFANKLRGSLFTCFIAWKEETRNNRIIKLRMGATFKRMQHQDLARGWQKWIAGIRTLNRNLLGEVKSERQKAEVQVRERRAGRAKRAWRAKRAERAARQVFL